MHPIITIISKIYKDAANCFTMRFNNQLQFPRKSESRLSYFDKSLTPTHATDTLVKLLLPPHHYQLLQLKRTKEMEKVEEKKKKKEKCFLNVRPRPQFALKHRKMNRRTRGNMISKLIVLPFQCSVLVRFKDIEPLVLEFDRIFTRNYASVQGCHFQHMF